jgi:two-component system, chemotaxis family, chemotaxis protein CheY
MATILIVDDSQTVRKYHSLVLTAMGYQTCEADDGNIALELLLTDHFDLVITDINMPRMDGFQFIEEIRTMREYDSIPVLIVSSQEQDVDFEHGRKLGVHSYFVKPTNIETLAAMVRSLLPNPKGKGDQHG